MRIRWWSTSLAQPRWAQAHGTRGLAWSPQVCTSVGAFRAVRSWAASSNTTQQPEQSLPAGQMPWEGPRQAGAGEPHGSGNLEELGCELEMVVGRGGAQEEAGTAAAEMSRRDRLRFPWGCWFIGNHLTHARLWSQMRPVSQTTQW